MLANNLSSYIDRKTTGTYQGDADDGGSGHNSEIGEVEHKRNTNGGPIGVILDNIHSMCATIDKNSNVRQVSEQSVNIDGIHWQHVKAYARDIATRARTLNAMNKRAETMNLKQIDRGVSMANFLELTLSKPICCGSP